MMLYDRRINLKLKYTKFTAISYCMACQTKANARVVYSKLGNKREQLNAHETQIKL